MISGKKINKEGLCPKILIAPLDWGLGHATRCIPIINELINQNCNVVIAAPQKIILLLKNEFPTLTFLEINGYNVKYSKNKSYLPFTLLRQLPKIFFSIKKENTWLKKVISEYEIDAVISDNRPGLYNKKIHCIYITHQLQIKTSTTFLENILRRAHYHFIKKYNECWVPDFKVEDIAGKLSHPKENLSNVVYIGALSRFKKLIDVPKKYNVLICLSGPEPQRTIFEKIIFGQLPFQKGTILLVRGLPDAIEIPVSNNDSLEIVNHLSATDLNLAFQQAEIIICRGGYSTIMDLIKIRQAAVLVATPGQTEQEYLCKYVMQKKYFYSVEQHNFSLKKTLSDISTFNITQPDFNFNEFKKTISEFVLSLKTSNFASQ